MRKELFVKIMSSLQGTLAMILITSRPVLLGRPEKIHNASKRLKMSYVTVWSVVLCSQIPVKSAGSTLTLKAHMKIFPSSKVTRIHTIGASRALWSMAENKYLQEDETSFYAHSFSVFTLKYHF